VSPPLPDTQPPAWAAQGGGAAGARDALKSNSRNSLHQPGSRETISGGPGPLYANVGQVSGPGTGRQQDGRSNTLPVQTNRNSGVSETDSLDTVSHSSKEKKGSVLGRFLGRKKLNS